MHCPFLRGDCGTWGQLSSAGAQGGSRNSLPAPKLQHLWNSHLGIRKSRARLLIFVLLPGKPGWGERARPYLQHGAAYQKTCLPSSPHPPSSAARAPAPQIPIDKSPRCLLFRRGSTGPVVAAMGRDEGGSGRWKRGNFLPKVRSGVDLCSRSPVGRQGLVQTSFPSS